MRVGINIVNNYTKYFCDCRIVPESVRWLLIKNKHEEAFEIIKKAARVNQKEISQNTLNSLKECCKTNQISPINEVSYIKMIKKLLSSKIMIKRILLLIYIW